MTLSPYGALKPQFGLRVSVNASNLDPLTEMLPLYKLLSSEPMTDFVSSYTNRETALETQNPKCDPEASIYPKTSLCVERSPESKGIRIQPFLDDLSLPSLEFLEPITSLKPEALLEIFKKALKPLKDPQAWLTWATFKSHCNPKYIDLSQGFDSEVREYLFKQGKNKLLTEQNGKLQIRKSFWDLMIQNQLSQLISSKTLKKNRDIEKTINPKIAAEAVVADYQDHFKSLLED